MSASYVAPLQQSWARMQRLLFRPFRLDFWFTLGFAAFLSEGVNHFGGGGGGPGKRIGAHAVGVPFRDVVRGVAAFLLHPVWGALLICLVVFATVVLLLFMWISSRGKFIFLDDVLHERSAIVEPWKRFAREGNSLFVFWVAMSMLSVCAVVGISLPLIPALLTAAATGEGWPLVLGLIVSWWVAAMIPLLLVVGYTHIFLFQFVVPIMYRDHLGVLDAWGRFFSLFKKNVVSFLAFGLFFLLLLLASWVAIMVVGFSTCCIGFVLVAIPYISSVVLLPIDVLFRGLGPDFLGQFGPEWAIQGKAPAAPPPAP